MERSMLSDRPSNSTQRSSLGLFCKRLWCNWSRQQSRFAHSSQKMQSRHSRSVIKPSESRWMPMLILAQQSSSRSVATPTCSSRKPLDLPSKSKLSTFDDFKYRMCLNCNEAKLMQTLLPQAKHKNPVVRCQIARCFECVIKQLGPALAESTNCDSIISALSNYISDSSPEVRFNARNAILALEYGPNPVGGRELNERLIRKALKAEAD